jgi:hypothetical protein
LVKPLYRRSRGAQFKLQPVHAVRELAKESTNGLLGIRRHRRKQLRCVKASACDEALSSADYSRRRVALQRLGFEGVNDESEAFGSLVDDGRVSSK